MENELLEKDLDNTQEEWKILQKRLEEMETVLNEQVKQSKIVEDNVNVTEKIQDVIILNKLKRMFKRKKGQKYQGNNVILKYQHLKCYSCGDSK